MTTTFDALGVAPDLVAVLAEQGITEPFPVQEMTIPDALAGRDVCGKAKTGSGKTLAFGLALAERAGESSPSRPRSLVLVPTRELANQVAAEIAPLVEVRGRTVQAVYGGTDVDRQTRALRKGPDIVVATPGRLIDLIERKAISLADIEVVVLDEADRMADMGFLPQVEWVLRHVDRAHQTMLFSATLDGAVDHVVRVHLSDPVFHEVQSERVEVDDMDHRFLLVHQMDKVKVAAAICGGVERCLVFVRTKRGADRLARQLQREGVTARPIHGDLHQGARERALSDFTDGTLHVLVATDVAARGIHVDEIDVVVHYDPPEDHKSYVHRSGRTARAGTRGAVATLVLWDQEHDIRMLQRRLGLDLPLVEVFSNDARLADLAAWDLDDDVADEVEVA
ncbi:MAG TPA: DEAD/DEAH box helicase [Acidimicrobiales bacterium]|nr:DEAD/DEAH box helicase [Acidimicrobiales bacterium]